MQHFLNFLPLPQGQGSLRPTGLKARLNVSPLTLPSSRMRARKFSSWSATAVDHVCA